MIQPVSHAASGRQTAEALARGQRGNAGRAMTLAVQQLEHGPNSMRAKRQGEL